MIFINPVSISDVNTSVIHAGRVIKLSFIFKSSTYYFYSLYFSAVSISERVKSIDLLRADMIEQTRLNVNSNLPPPHFLLGGDLNINIASSLEADAAGIHALASDFDLTDIFKKLNISDPDPDRRRFEGI